MALKKKASKAVRGSRNDTQTHQTVPKFPYTTKPGSLRRVLKEIPSKPKPTKFDKVLLRSWGFKDSNDSTMLRVLKAIGLLGNGNEPTELYGRFMNLTEGARALGPEIKNVYAPMFQASHAPYNEGSEKLKNLFNIHSGGGERVLDFQIQTFKALCENASFDQLGAPASAGATAASQSSVLLNQESSPRNSASPIIHINLHIHLPENKSRRDYEDIIEDIGRYIFGRTSEVERGS